MIQDYNGRNLRLLTSVVTDPNGRDHNVCQCVSGTEREIEREEREREREQTEGRGNREKLLCETY